MVISALETVKMNMVRNRKKCDAEIQSYSISGAYPMNGLCEICIGPIFWHKDKAQGMCGADMFYYEKTIKWDTHND